MRITNPVYLCPSAPEWTNNRNHAYGYNFQFLGNMRVKSSGNGFINFPVPLSRLRAADTILITDAMGTAAGKPRMARTAYREDGADVLTALANHAWALDPPRLTATSDYADFQTRSAANRTAPDPRHSNKANAAFCDGHVDRVSLQQLGYVVNGDDSVAVSGTEANNRLFSGTGQDDNPPSIN
jgi:prepilin-type processing-associated H-X9-DG protein